MKLEKIEIMPCGLSSSFKANTLDFNKKIKNGNIIELKKIAIALAGPITSFILAIVFTYIDIPNISMQEVVYSNILILIFNLIPLYPLDGGRIIKSLIYIELGKEKSDYIIGKISFITITILTIISSIAVYYFKNIAIFLICIFLWVIIGQFKRKNSKTLDILR